MRVIGRVTAQRRPGTTHWAFYVQPYTADMRVERTATLSASEVAAMPDSVWIPWLSGAARMDWPVRQHVWRVWAWRAKKDDDRLVVRMSRTWRLTSAIQPPEYQLFKGEAAFEHWLLLLRIANGGGS